MNKNVIEAIEIILTAAIGIGGSLIASHYGVSGGLCKAAMTAGFVIPLSIIFFG